MAKLRRKPDYPADKLGAQCQVCPLKGRRRIPSTTLKHSDNKHQNIVIKLVIVADYPGKNETACDEPMVGPAGNILDNALREAGLSRDDCFITNASCCQPRPGMKDRDIARAVELCHPRLVTEIDALTCPILACGPWAAKVMTGRKDVEPWRGYKPVIAKYDNCLVTWNPAHFFSRPAELPIFVEDIRRAVGQVPPLSWPELVIEPGRRMQEALLQLGAEPVLAVDIENMGDPMDKAPMRCVGIAGGQVAVSVPITDGTSKEEALLRGLLNGPSTKIGHNISHDILGLQELGWPISGPYFDTLLAHSITDPLLSHALTNVASYELNLPRWKSEFKVLGDKDRGLEHFKKVPLRDLQLYNAKDAWTTLKLYHILVKKLGTVHRGQELYDERLELSDVAMEMRRAGMAVDQERMSQHRASYSAILATLREQFTIAAPLVHVVPGQEIFHKQNRVTGEKVRTHAYTKVYIGPYRLGKSGQHDDMGRLFFGRLGCRPRSYTESGQPQLDKLGLTALIQEPNPAIRKVASIVLKYRQNAKITGTYLKETRDAVHPVWKVYGAVTGRWSSADPNLQNQPEEIRDIYVPRPGNIFVGADYDALELRILALLSQDQNYLQWFAAGKKPHIMNGKLIFGRELDKNDGGRDERAYRLTKNCVYGSNYGGGPEKIWTQIVAEEPDVKLTAVKKIYYALNEAHPGVTQWRLDQIDLARRQGYVEELLSGLREYFPGGVEPTKALNFPIQGWAGVMMNRVLQRLSGLLAGTGCFVTAQIHDQVVLEGPLDKARWMCDILEEEMQKPVRYQGQDFWVPAEAVVAKNLKEAK